MQYFTEQASTHSEALRKIRIKYGERAKVLTHRTIRMGGVFGLFTREGIELSGYLSPEDSGKPKAKTVDKAADKAMEEKQKILDSVKGDSALQKVLEELRSLKEELGKNGGNGSRSEDPEILHSVEQLLSDNEFSSAFVTMMGKKLRSSLSMEDLADEETVHERVLEWLGENIPLYENGEKRGKKIMVLIGPTGVGKTTTVAKLAAIHRIGTKGERAKDVRIITIDNYRIGAKKQMETYAEILEVPFAGVESHEDLQKTVSLYRDADLILVDTIGKSPKDYMNLAKMREVLEGCGGQAEVHLALSATTKVSDIKEILRQFEPFGYSSVILTKLDETMRVGNVISALWEMGKKVSYITDGQAVPEDIERAGVVRFLKTLEGFSIAPERLREKFDSMYASSPADGTSFGFNGKGKVQEKENEGITAAEQRYLYSYGADKPSEEMWSKK
jgi:flagellar biosynthesis protein FlhF